MSVVVGPLLLSRRTEGLAGARAGPYFSVVGPPCESERVRPTSEPCEEVALVINGKVIWSNIYYTPLVYIAVRKMSRSY
jgi:hypothetical protein|tara:strand:+ start:656 stop:892 length:237 start_codon:yes stop_codon:yes gene_type:complete